MLVLKYVPKQTYDSKANVNQARCHAEVLLQAIDRAERNDGEEREANQTCAFWAGTTTWLAKTETIRGILL